MMTTKTRSRRITEWTLRLIVAIAAPALLYLAWDQATYNFGTVQPGRIYRSGQMPARALARTLQDNRIKTVLNLRGSNQGDAWYREEVAATNQAEATQCDVAMSSCVWMSRSQLRALVRVLRTAEYPMLIHCAWGSERTGLVSAFAELLRPGGTLEEARAQFSIAYLFMRVGDGKVMAEHLEQYERWLHESGLHHEPANFLRWVDEGFHPGVPSREQWQYDPYPLVVITRPGLPAGVRLR
jgi:protein-tyrosine phosphatase